MTEAATESALVGGAFVEVRDVEKTFPPSDRSGHPVTALRAASLQISRSEFVSIIGPSGCGKTTLFMLVAGLARPTKGDIIVDGKEVARPVTDLGIVFQSDVLLDWRTVYRNIMLQIEMRGLRHEDYAEWTMNMLKDVGLEGFEERYPWELSGGMRQRVSICRALVHDPPLLLMDEPFGALDAITREAMNVLLMRLLERYRKTVLFITHSINEAVFLSDRVLVMSRRPGRIAAEIPIDLRRPREPQVMATEEFAAYSSRLRQCLIDAGAFDS